MALAFVSQEELRMRLGNGAKMLILDVRRQVDYENSSLKIKGALRLSPDDVHSFASQLPKDGEIIVYSRYEKEEAGQRVVQQLRDWGFQKVYPLVGGFQGWLSAGLEMEPK